jgi:hypothetical protein
MRNPAFLLGAAVALAFSLSSLWAQETDLSGTWEGTAYVPDQGDNEITMVLRKEGESYSGTITDSMGFANESNLENAKFADGTLTAEFMIFNGSDYVRLYVTLKVSGGTLVGDWSDRQSESGSIELKRKS